MVMLAVEIKGVPIKLKYGKNGAVEYNLLAI